MYKAPTGRVETIQQALGPDLRNLPIPAPSDRIASAILRAVRDVAALTLDEGERGHPSGCRCKGCH
jgi:hypothetical protein